MRLHPDTLFGDITMNEKSFVNTAPLGGLYSGRILRSIVQSLDVQDEVLTNRTARRFFSGQHVDEHNRNQIFDALGQALITRGLAPETLEDLPETLPMASVVGMTLMMVCGEWDRLMAHIQACSGQAADVGEAVAQLLRLVVVDAALRLFALVYLDLEGPPESEPPPWVLENGTGNILRQRLRDAGLTRDHLAASLGVWPTSVDNWLDGKNRPSHENIAALARELASRERGGDAAALERSLNRQISLAAMADQIAAGIGRDKLIEPDHKAGSFCKGVVAVAGASPNPGGRAPGDCAQPDHAGFRWAFCRRPAFVAGRPGDGPRLALEPARGHQVLGSRLRGGVHVAHRPEVGRRTGPGYLRCDRSRHGREPAHYRSPEAKSVMACRLRNSAPG